MNIGPCEEWAGGKYANGYGRVRHNGPHRLAHRVAYVKAHGLKLEDIDGLIVRHKCDNRACIRPSHLLLGSQADNIKDMVDRGRQAKGTATNRSKLTAAQVLDIRRRLKEKEKQINLAAEFGVCKQLITLIKQNKIWTHV